MPRAILRKRRDRNHAEIRDGLRDIPGVSVADTASLGDGFPDLVVGYMRTNYIFELKPDTIPSEQKLTPEEKQWHETWRGQIHTITNINQALHIMGIGDGSIT